MRSCCVPNARRNLHNQVSNPHARSSLRCGNENNFVKQSKQWVTRWDVIDGGRSTGVKKSMDIQLIPRVLSMRCLQSGGWANVENMATNTILLCDDQWDKGSWKSCSW